MTKPLRLAHGGHRAPEVAVIGAGVVGLSVAFHLAERGLHVVIYERRGIAAEASGVQPGGVRQQWSTTVNCVLARESYFFYRSLQERLGVVVDATLEACGYLFVAHSNETFARLRRYALLQRQLGIPTEILSSTEAALRAPALDVSGVTGASFCSEDGYFDRPQTVVAGFADAATKLGVQIEYAAVRALEQDGSGWALQLANGDAARAAQVVIAAGYDSPEVAATVGVTLPIDKTPRHLFFSDRIGESLLRPLVVAPDHGFAVKQLADGRLLASDLSAGDDVGAEETWRQRVRVLIRELVPVLEYVSLPMLVTGHYDVTPDHRSIIGAIDGLDGLWIAAGFSGHGFMIAPAVGAALTRAIETGAMEERLAELAPARFASGASLVAEGQVV